MQLLFLSLWWPSVLPRFCIRPAPYDGCDGGGDDDHDHDDADDDGGRFWCWWCFPVATG